MALSLFILSFNHNLKLHLMELSNKKMKMKKNIKYKREQLHYSKGLN